jgi:dienelactone hydrolase
VRSGGTALAILLFGVLASAGRAAEPVIERVALPADEPYAASVLTYRSHGLRVRALVAVPHGERPPHGFPVVVANHGFHPDPLRYGYSIDGRNLRPGDYYRAVPRWYTAAGFMVVMPDYRGHNDSEGAAGQGGPGSLRDYATDVHALFGVLRELPEADVGRVFLWGHSMGAAVTLHALALLVQTRQDAATKVLGAALWSGSGSAAALGALDLPVLVQHAVDDPVAPVIDSEQLGRALGARGRLHALQRWPGRDHFFTGAQAAEAVRLDIDFFRQRILEADSE